MVRKLMVVLVILAAVFLIWLFISAEFRAKETSVHKRQKEDNPEQLVKKLNSINEKNKGSQQKERKKAIKESAKKTADNELDSFLNEISERQFSDDPVVEVESLMHAYMLCFEDYSTAVYFRGKLSIKAQQQITQAQSGCDKFRGRYPSLKNSVATEALLKQLQPSTAYGMLRTKPPSEDDYSDHSLDLYFATLESKSGVLIAFMGYWINVASAVSLDHPLAQTLNTEDRLYLNSVAGLATRKLSCGYQNGISCSANSYFMLEQCVSNDAFCGMDFETWFDQVTMPGQKRDVELMLAYLKEVSAGE